MGKHIRYNRMALKGGYITMLIYRVTGYSHYVRIFRYMYITGNTTKEIINKAKGYFEEILSMEQITEEDDDI